MDANCKRPQAAPVFNQSPLSQEYLRISRCIRL